MDGWMHEWIDAVIITTVNVADKQFHISVLNFVMRLRLRNCESQNAPTGPSLLAFLPLD